MSLLGPLSAGALTQGNTLQAPGAENPFRTPSFVSTTSDSPQNDSEAVSSHSEIPVERTEKRRSHEDSNSYVIQHLADADDDGQMSPWKRLVYGNLPLVEVLASITFWTYMALRVWFVRRAEAVNHDTFMMAWAFISVEFAVAAPVNLHRFLKLFNLKERKRPRLRLYGPIVPSVDVIITCCKEEDESILDTARAACDIDYPADKFRVLVCDDGASNSLRQLVETLAEHKHPNLHYFSREKGQNHHFKAGNLNSALDETRKMPGGPSTYFAALDADMIPEKNWLRALLPHLIRDKECCMSCPPQLFYNIPKDDPLSQSLNTFVHVMEPLKDAMGVAWCTGSGYVLRRKAIDQVGGFPTGSLSEDVCCSSVLLGAGWKTAFVHEPLQWGTVPDSLTSHLKQRTRWTIGTVQTAVKLRFGLFGTLCKKMTLWQRLCGFIFTISTLCTIILVLSLFTTPIILISGEKTVQFHTEHDLKYLVWAAFAMMTVIRIEEWVLFLPSGYRTGQRDTRATIWMAPYHALCIVQSFLLPRWLGGKVAVFTSSGSQEDELNERSAESRAPLHRRLWVTLWGSKAYLHLAYIFFMLTAVAISTYRCVVNEENNTPRRLLIALGTHCGWPPLLWLVFTVSCWTPIHYAIFPPTMPPRNELLNRDETTQVAHPREEYKSIKCTKLHWFHEFVHTGVYLYSIVWFVLSFRL